MNSNSRSLKKFAEEIYTKYKSKHKYNDIDEFTKSMTKRYKEVAECIGISSNYLKAGRDYTVFADDEEFIIKVILEDYDSNENMINIRGEYFDKVDSKYTETIIEGFEKILIKNNISNEDLSSLIKEVKKNTKIEVREKCLEVENVIVNILKEVQEYRADYSCLIDDTNEIITELDKLKSDLSNIYKKYISGGYNEPHEYDLNLIRTISEVNRKEREKIGDAAYEENIRIDALANAMYNQSEEFKVIQKELDDQYNHTNFKIKRDREIKKLYQKQNDIKDSMKQKILKMSEEEREQLNKKIRKKMRDIILGNKKKGVEE